MQNPQKTLDDYCLYLSSSWSKASGNHFLKACTSYKHYIQGQHKGIPDYALMLCQYSQTQARYWGEWQKFLQAIDEMGKSQDIEPAKKSLANIALRFKLKVHPSMQFLSNPAGRSAA